MTDKPMSDADFLYARALDLDDCAPVYAEQMRAIAKRLEEIDAPKLRAEQSVAAIIDRLDVWN